MWRTVILIAVLALVSCAPAVAPSREYLISTPTTNTSRWFPLTIVKVTNTLDFQWVMYDTAVMIYREKTHTAVKHVDGSVVEWPTPPYVVWEAGYFDDNQ